MLVQDLHEPIIDPQDKEKKVNFVVNYFVNNRNMHTMYAIKFFVCEILNTINVLSQIYFMDFFLGGEISYIDRGKNIIFFLVGEFSRYGSDLLAISELPPEERVDPMSRVFPKMTKCTFHKFGPSGTVERFDGLCVLPLNIINEKIYLFLWFWFILVTVLSLLQIGT